MGRGIRLVWRAARQWTLLWGMLLLLQGLVPAALVYMIRYVVNILAGAAGTPGTVFDKFSPVWAPVAVMGVLWVLSQVLSSLVNRARTVQAEFVQDHINDLIHAKALGLDMSFYDHPDSYDLLYRASVDAIHQPLNLLENLGNFIQNSVTLLALAVLLAGYAFWMPLLLIASALPGLWVVGNFVLREHKWRVKNTINNRLVRYYDWLMTERESAAEVRLFGLGPHFRDQYRRVRSRLRSGRLRLARDEMKTELIAGLVAWSGGLIGIGWMLLRTLRGVAQLGDLVLCYQAFQQGQALLRSMLSSTGQIYRSTLFLENLFQFLAIESQVNDNPSAEAAHFEVRREIRFEDVSFTYPGSERFAVENFSLSLEAGRVTAIVGHNGSGKSTLIKLLCRFYDPQTGKIRVDGKDLREMDLASLRRQITVLFQEPVHYHTTAAENITLGSLDDADDKDKIDAAAQASGMKSIIRKLPLGYDTVLGKWFGGAELSVGEWQRLALARAFFRDASIIVLDEPTSAMDSWAEAEWLARFRELSAGHTVLIITHRFTTAMHADIIHVMEDGRIVESGAHEQLVENGGRYAESWRMQMREVLSN